MKNIFILIVLINTLLGQETPDGVLDISPGAISQGLGEAMIAYTETADISYFNPAAMSFSNKNRISGSTMKWKPNFTTDLFHEFIAINYKINDKYAIGGNLIWFNLGEQVGMDNHGNPTGNFYAYQAILSINVSYRFSNSSSFGLTHKSFHEKVSYDEDGYQAFDISYFVQKNNNLNTGFKIASISSNQAAPTIISWGLLKKVYYKGQNTIKALSQIDKHLRFNEEIIYKVGIEYNYSEKLFLRAGYMYGKQPGNLKLNNLTYGFGVRLLHYGFDFGHTLGNKDNIISRAGTNYFSIVITFNN